MTINNDGPVVPQAALALAVERGWYLFPAQIVDKTKKSHKSAKFSNGRNWGATNDAEEIKRDFARWPNALLGIPTGKDNGFFVLEADTPKGHDVDGIASLRQLEVDHEPLPNTLMAESPSGSLHHYFNLPSNAVVRNSASRIAPGIDVRGEGGMVIAPPSPRGNGQYRWLNIGTPIADAPEWLLAIIAECDGGEERNSGDEPEADIKLVAAALKVIPNDDLNWEDWNKICMAIFRATSGKGFAICDSWSQKSKKYDAANTAAKWNGYFNSPPTSIGVGTLFYMASGADWHWREEYDAAVEAAVEQAGRNAAAGFMKPRAEEPRAEEQKPNADDQKSQKTEEPKSEQKTEEPKTGKPKTPRNYVLVRASEIVPRAKNWIWHGHLLRGAQELLAGVPGLAKSQLQCSLIACATTGSQWPDGNQSGVKSNVIMVTAEDTLEQEVTPRLIAAGADLKAVFFLKAIKKNNAEHMFLLSEDIKILEQIIRDVGNVGLVTIDPITAFMGKVDSHHVTVVRSQLGPLKDLAERTEVSFSTITHPAKNAGARAIDHFIGSQAFIAAGRIGHLCVEEVDENNKPTGRILFTNPKNNPSPKMPTLAYRIEQLTVSQDPETGASIVAPRVVWDSTPVQMTADQAIAANAGKKKPEVKNHAVDFLRRELANGPRPVEEIKKAANEAGLSWRTVRRAQEDLKIDPYKDGLGPWTWKLPVEFF